MREELSTFELAAIVVLSAVFGTAMPLWAVTLV
jgi:hypothetical protein